VNQLPSIRNTGIAMARPRADKPKSSVANVRLTDSERAEMGSIATHCGFKTVSEYLRFLHRAFADAQQAENGGVRASTAFPRRNVRAFRRTRSGEILWGDSRSYLFSVAKPSSVDLIMTSPPFGLVRKKSYGNKDADEYCDWFRPFAEGFLRVLKDDGSLVIDIGGAWIPGQPTRSLYHFKLLVMLVEEYGFHLCQEHYWWNPSKLPTPAEWVNVRRVRVKDAVNCIWWLSKTPFPKANNRRVLQPYSESMQHLLKNGYTAKKRPSGHDISVKFQKDNGGAVPPNLLAVANTESTSRYQEYCRDNNLPIHPARFPAQLPEYFIRLLTDPGDVVVDPFAGSCVTGAVAEAMGRRWICCEMSEEYLQGALSRFVPKVQSLPRYKAATYEIAAPCSMPANGNEAPLFADGGKKRPKLGPSKIMVKRSNLRTVVPPRRAALSP
jgi:site-specific DNA-methyltransferase (cytosine-N4-specific)